MSVVHDKQVCVQGEKYKVTVGGLLAMQKAGECMHGEGAAIFRDERGLETE